MIIRMINLSQYDSPDIVLCTEASNMENSWILKNVPQRQDSKRSWTFRHQGEQQQHLPWLPSGAFMLAYIPFTYRIDLLINTFSRLLRLLTLLQWVLGTENAFVWQSKLLYVNNATLAVRRLDCRDFMAKSLGESLEETTSFIIITAVVSFLLLNAARITSKASIFWTSQRSVRNHVPVHLDRAYSAPSSTKSKKRESKSNCRNPYRPQ